MALLVTGNWYEATFYNTNNAAWSALAAPRPAIPNNLIDNIVTGTATLIYVTDSASGSFSFEGGAATGFDDTLLPAAPAALSAFTLTDDNGASTVYGQTPGGDVYMYNAATGLVQKYVAADVALFKAWLP